MTVTAEARDALTRHGYNPDALAGGVSTRPGSSNATATWRGAQGTLLRYHVCYLDGIEIDGHEFSDLDPGSNNCLHCDYDLDDEDRTWQWRQLFAWISHAVVTGGTQWLNELAVRKKMRELDPTLQSNDWIKSSIRRWGGDRVCFSEHSTV